jgi:hypothetical protein
MTVLFSCYRADERDAGLGVLIDPEYEVLTELSLCLCESKVGWEVPFRPILW